MKFWVELAPPAWKRGDAAHFINVEKRLQRQVGFLKKLRAQKVVESGPYAILNREVAGVSMLVNVDSWEHLSHVLHEDPMSIYQAPQVSYLADWDKAMAKHESTRGSDRTLEDDVRVDTGVELLRAEIAKLTEQLQAVLKKK